jgi:flagellar biosynthetic protein FlhB
MGTFAGNAMLAVMPLALLCMVAGVAVNVAQVKFKPSFQAIKPDIKRINPASGFKRIFGTHAVVETIKSVAKVSVVGIVAGLAIAPRLSEFGAMVGLPPEALGSLLGATVLDVAKRVAIAYLAIAAADFGYQKWKHEKDLRMDHQEVKEEHKSHDLPPEVRASLRRRQMQAARARMMAAVPEADVVVTNPTHYAVALKYDGARLAPEVVAKGKDLVAAHIRRIAAENDVPVISDPPLARSLHASVEVGHVIPEELYQAVAQLLAFVYRLNGRKAVASA